MKLLCLTIGSELGRLRQLLDEYNIKNEWKLKIPKISTFNTVPGENLTCIYEVYVEEDDLDRSNNLLNGYGQAVWMWKQ
jgi:hypothetical protein